MGSSIVDCKQFFKVPVKKGLLLQIASMEADESKAKLPTKMELLLHEFEHVF